MDKLSALAKDAKINENASIRDQHSTVINAPIQRVWNKLIHLNEWNEWNPAVSKMEVLDGVKEKGHFTWSLNGSKVKSEIQRISEPNTFSWTCKSNNVKRIYVWQLESDDEQTIVTISTSLQGIFVVLQSHQKVFAELLAWLEYLKKNTEEEE
jgi:uncharacterized protein YndB with AHSA1/START domain